MTYGLPTRGQRDWDDELNNSVESLRSEAQAATAAAEQARSNATQAIALAQEARARVTDISGLTGEDSAVALLLGDDGTETATATDARTETKVTADATDAASPIGAALRGAYAAYGISKNHSTAGPLLEFATLGSGATLHLLAGAGSTAPYVLGVGVDHDNSPTGVHVSVKGNNSIGYGVALETTSGSGSKGFLGQNFSSGELIRLVAGSAATGPLATLNNTFGGTGKLVTWDTTTTDGEISSNGNVLITGATAEYSVQHATASQNRARVRVNTSATMLDLDHFAGGSLWYGHRVDTSGFSLRLRQVNAATALGSGTYQTLIELNNGNKLGFYGVTPITRPVAIASPTADVASLKVAVDAIRNSLTNLGLTA